MFFKKSLSPGVSQELDIANDVVMVLTVADGCHARPIFYESLLRNMWRIEWTPVFLGGAGALLFICQVSLRVFVFLYIDMLLPFVYKHHFNDFDIQNPFCLPLYIDMDLL